MQYRAEILSTDYESSFQQNEYFYHLIPLIIQNYPHILQKRRLKTESISAIGVAVSYGLT